MSDNTPLLHLLSNLKNQNDIISFENKISRIAIQKLLIHKKVFMPWFCEYIQQQIHPDFSIDIIHRVIAINLVKSNAAFISEDYLILNDAITLKTSLRDIILHDAIHQN